MEGLLITLYCVGEDTKPKIDLSSISNASKDLSKRSQMGNQRHQEGRVNEGILPYANDFKGGGPPSSGIGTLEEDSGLSVQQTWSCFCLLATTAMLVRKPRNCLWTRTDS